MDLDVFMSKEDAVRLAKLAGGTIVMTLHETKKKAPYSMNIKGGCQFLKQGACSIHEDRPQACRSFPISPTDDCAVWPRMRV